MKSFIFLLLFISCSQLSTTQFVISNEVYNSSKLSFIPHQGPGPFDNYLSMEINYSPVKELREKWEKKLGRALLNRGEAHITVITPPEYQNALKKFVSIEEINQIAKNNNIQNSKFEVICIGKGQLQTDSQNTESTYFLVVASEDLLRIREAIFKLFIERGGNIKEFNPLHFYPHITLGFTKRDLHESDGVIKNEKSCVQKVRDTFYF